MRRPGPDVLGISGKDFLTTYPRWAHTSARSYAIALAYLFGFTELHLLGNVVAARSRGKCSAGLPSTKRWNRSLRCCTDGASGHRKYRADREPGLPCAAAQPQPVAGRPVRGRAAGAAGEHVDPVLAAPERPQPPPGAGGARVCAFSTATGAIDPGAGEGVDPVWADWVQRWHNTSTLPASGRKGRRNQMLRMGRWLAAEHPESGSRASGPESCARPGSLPSTGCASATTPKMTTPCETASGSR